MSFDISKVSTVNEIVAALPYISDDFSKGILLARQVESGSPKTDASNVASGISSQETSDMNTPQPVGKDTATLFQTSTPPNATNPIPINSSFGKTDRVGRYWVVDKSDPVLDEKETESSLFPEYIHEVHQIVETVFETESVEGVQYLSFDDSEEELERKRKMKRKNNFLLDEASSWKGHMFSYSFSPERFHKFQVALLPILVPMISRH